MELKVLVACEESQAVTIELRKLGHDAYSCDILPCSGGHPEWHIKCDILQVINNSFQTFGQFWTEDETAERIDKWDLMIAFPPCTHLAVSGAAWFEEKIKNGRQQQGIDFFMALVKAPINKIVIENPIGIMSKIYREPDQIIQPYEYGDEAQKSTCLWLKGVNKLEPTNIVGKGEMMQYVEKKTGKVKQMAKWYNDARSGNHGHKRSKTFPGIAKAMAYQFTQPLKQLNLWN